MNRPQLAVIGGGHLGRIHTRLLQSRPDVQLVGVVDPILEARHRVSQEFGVDTFADCREILSKIDAAIVATPTRLHHDVARRLLAHGKHVFIEKPITHRLSEADDLVELAGRRKLVLQVGHVERFNPAFVAGRNHIGQCGYIEAARSSTFTTRSVDIGVVLDLMIHDIDLVLALNPADVVDVQALGVTLFGPHEDMVQARLQLSNGCVVNLSASRTSFVAQRRFQVFHDGGYVGMDLAAGTATSVAPAAEMLDEHWDWQALPAQERASIPTELFQRWLKQEPLHVEPRNAILEEQSEFIEALRGGESVQVPGTAARDALAVAEMILAAVERHRKMTSTESQSNVRQPRRAA